MRVDALLPAILRRLVSVRQEASLDEVVQLLAKSGRDLLVVCDDAGFALGVVTRTDAMRQLGRGNAGHGAAWQMMTQPIVACAAVDDLASVWQLMHARQLSNLPVLSHRNLPIGVLAARDALAALLSLEHEQEVSLIQYIAGVGYC